MNFKSKELGFWEKAYECGTIECVSYEAYSVFDVNSIIKKAYVYLPYGYDESKKYNVLYLCHGLSGTSGKMFEATKLVNVLDNLIEKKIIEPLIVVTPTYDRNDSSDTSYNDSVSQLVPFCHEFENYLVPFIETKYSTYALSGSKEDLINSRNHRAFGGFSLGGVLTWHIFQNCSLLVKNFLPVSCPSWSKYICGDPLVNANDLLSRVWVNKNDFYIDWYIGSLDDVFYEEYVVQSEVFMNNDFFKNKLKCFVFEEIGHDFELLFDALMFSLPNFFKE